ncbi:MAG: glutamate-cysteine ligase family protein, partial [Gemmatimonadaceae bacterium]
MMRRTPERLFALLEADLRRRAFAPRAPGAPRRIGAEVELIPVSADGGEPVPIEQRAPAGNVSARERGTLPLLRRVGAGRGWLEERSQKGIPSFRLPCGGSITFEPGGQIEYGSPPCNSASQLLHRLREVIEPLREEALKEGITLLAAGIDPVNELERVPLRLGGERYVAMDRYLGSIGPAGQRMMRQTASIQVNLDLGDEAMLRWRVLNRAAPFVTAAFANSPWYGGRATGYQSWRAECWRRLDERRTGIFPGDGDAVSEYLRFAMRAPAMMMPRDGRYLPFECFVRSGAASFSAWRTHLSTLFPEVRPRGYLEVRSCDSIPPEWHAAPIALLAGITYDAEALRTAAEILPEGDEDLLH